MPYLSTSSYRNPPWPLSLRHVQTILPSYFRKGEEVPFEQEVMPTPDGDELQVDWCRQEGSDTLVIISHGLAGHSHRHYVRSLVAAFSRQGWDSLAWNYRGTGGSPGKLLKMTTNNSTEELGWVTDYALRCKPYRRVYYTGYSMGGNLTTLFLTREADKLPPQVAGGIVFNATTDLKASIQAMETPMGRVYSRHFVKDLVKMLREKDRQFPGKLNLEGVESLETFQQFDDRFTAPLCGFKDAADYYETASSCRHYGKLRVPLCMVAPKNDPMLGGECYPIEEAKRNPNLFLEIPSGGGHCGFITFGSGEWWPARRAVEFLRQIQDGKINPTGRNLSK